MFVNKFGMKCSTENFKRLIPKLESLGYRLSVPTYNKDSIIIRKQRNWEFTDLGKDYMMEPNWSIKRLTNLQGQEITREEVKEILKQTKINEAKD